MTHTPRSECVNATDKGVREILYGKAKKKGVSGESNVDSLRLKAAAGNPRLSEGMGKRLRWGAGEGILFSFGREVEVCGAGRTQGSDVASVSPRAVLRPDGDNNSRTGGSCQVLLVTGWVLFERKRKSQNPHASQTEASGTCSTLSCDYRHEMKRSIVCPTRPGRKSLVASMTN